MRTNKQDVTKMSAKELVDIPQKEISGNIDKVNNKKIRNEVRRGKPQNSNRNPKLSIDDLVDALTSYQNDVNSKMAALYDRLQQYEAALNSISTMVAKHDGELTTLNGVVVRLSNNIQTELTNLISSVDTAITEQISEQVDYKIAELLDASGDYADEDEPEDYDEDEPEEETENNSEEE